MRQLDKMFRSCVTKFVYMRKPPVYGFRLAGSGLSGTYHRNLHFDRSDKTAHVLQSLRSSIFSSTRSLSSTEDAMSEGERHITSLLQSNFPEATEIDVRDVSGGCGTMYQIYIEAEEFRGKKLVDQQRMVNKVLEKEIKDMHGLSLQTVVPVK